MSTINDILGMNDPKKPKLQPAKKPVAQEKPVGNTAGTQGTGEVSTQTTQPPQPTQATQPTQPTQPAQATQPTQPSWLPENTPKGMIFTEDGLKKGMSVADEERFAGITDDNTTGTPKTPAWLEKSEEEKEWERERELAQTDLMAALNSAINRYKPETEEEAEQREKREKRERLLATIGDGLKAIHKSYTRAAGLQPITDDVVISDKVRARQEKLKADRDKDERYQLELLRSKYGTYGDALKEKRIERERMQRVMYYVQKLENDAKKAEAEADKLEAQGRHEEAKAKREEAEAKKKEAEAKEKEEKAKWVGPVAKSQIGANNARANNSNAAADEHRAGASKKRNSAGGGKGGGKGSSGGGRTKTVTKFDRNGNVRETTVTKEGDYTPKNNSKNNAPPSRSNMGNNDNTPPSKRKQNRK